MPHHKCIWIDDGFALWHPGGMDADGAARRVGELFPAVYLHFHRRRNGRPLTPQMWGVLQHLAHAGPLTIGEAARHFRRAQSVVSGIVDGLERKGLIERMRDPRDRRRALVWLTDEGQRVMATERQVLSHEHLQAALARLSARERRALVVGMEALVRAASKGERHG
jgi:DNA-binding MarR family transcriptional regulator